MVAVIKNGYSIHRILNYNENKVTEGVATCIGAENYPIDHTDLSVNQKLNRLLKQAALNPKAKCNAIHVSLNFDPSENLSEARLKEIADTYMSKIGYGEQPYLVYQHFDAGHPHIHIVTTLVRADGTRIKTNNNATEFSEPARKEIEKMFSLVSAEQSNKKNAYQLKPIRTEKVKARKSETRRSIANVLEHVLSNYKFTSLPELNAVLNQYNVVADQGSKNSRVFKHEGLLYNLLNDKGEKDCVPIKASNFNIGNDKPTLKYLRTRFTRNEALRIPNKKSLRTAVDQAISSPKVQSLQDLKEVLEKQGIHVRLWTNKEGIMYGITLVDHNTKSVFNGSALGKTYSLSAIQGRISEHLAAKNQKAPAPTAAIAIHLPPQGDTATQTSATPMSLGPTETEEQTSSSGGGRDLLDILTQAENPGQQLPYHLRKSRRKKRRRLNNNN